jgi:acetyl-CoA acetyltransferase
MRRKEECPVLRDRAAIVGIGQTAFAKRLEPSETELAATAILLALDDAGIDAREVDALARYSMETTDEVEIARNVGMGGVTFFTEIGYGGGAGPAAIGQVALAIAGGVANVGVVWRSRKRGSGPRPWASMGSGGRFSFTHPYGLIRPSDEVAMLTRRYMHEFGATRDHLANVALACRKHANRNPHAIMHDRELTRSDYMASRWISEPLCLFDNCLETDGALAAVIVSAERALDCRQKPAYVHAFAQGLPPEFDTMTNYYSEDPLLGPSWTAARALWRNSDFGPSGVDVAQIYDAFTPLVLLSLEGYGFCSRGEAPAFTENANLEWNTGSLPINTSGGGLSEAYVHGFNLILEGVRQIRGTSTCQVKDAETCLVTGGEGPPTSALLLRR